jgi:hypothetical protein
MTAETTANNAAHSSEDDDCFLEEEFVLLLAAAHYDKLARSAATEELRAAARAKYNNYDERLRLLIMRVAAEHAKNNAVTAEDKQRIAAHMAALDAQVLANLKAKGALQQQH